MNDMAKLLLLLAIVGAVRAGHQDQPGGPHYTRTALGDAIDLSSMKLLKESFEVAKDKNVVCSPLGVMLLLSLYNSGAGAESKEEINQFLGGGDFEQLSTSYQHLSDEFFRMDPSFFTLANKAYVSDKYTPTEQFVAAANAYKSGVETLDFQKPADAAKVINKWASEKTAGNIKSPVSPNTLDPATAAALFNVIYFKGHWQVPFEVRLTEEKDFHVDRKTTIKKPLMHMVRRLKYKDSDELGASMVELPYEEDGFRMIVVLPHEVDGLPSVLEKAAQNGMLSDVFTMQTTNASVRLNMPKFDIRTKLDFNQILPKVGVSKIFTEPAMGIVKDQPVVISKVFQEAFIKVDEKGSTAGAVTGVEIMPVSLDPNRPRPVKFTVDHPFLFLIMYEDKILFSGTDTH